MVDPNVWQRIRSRNFGLAVCLFPCRLLGMHMPEIRRIRTFTSEHDFRSPIIVRVHNSLLKQLGGRNSWVKITNGDRVIYRICKGIGKKEHFYEDNIETDYDSRLELDIDRTKTDDHGWFLTSLTISRCTLLDTFLAHWTHPELGYRFPIQLSLVSLGLGLVGLLLGLMSLVK